MARSRTIAESLLERLLTTFPPERAYARAAFSQDPMPDAVARFLRHALRQRLRRETSVLQQVVATEWTDGAHPDVQQARQQLLSALDEHAQIPAAAWPTLLDRATRRVVAFLVEPRRTLVEQLFEDDQPLPVAAIRQQMEAFAPYAYLREGVEAFVRNHAVDELSPDHVDELLRRIDRQTTADYDTDDWVQLLDPLYELVARARPEGEGVPVPLLGAFFSEKGHRRAVRRLREAHEQDEIDQLSAEDLRRLLEAPEAATSLPTTVRSAPLPDAGDSELAFAGPEVPESASSNGPPVVEERSASPARPPATSRATAHPDDLPDAAQPVSRREPPPSSPSSPSRTPASAPDDAPVQHDAPPAEPPTPAAGGDGDPLPLWKQFQKGIQRAPATGERVTQRRGFHSTPDIEREEESVAPEEESSPPSVPRWMQYHEPDDEEDDDGLSLDVLERSVLGPSGPRNRDLFLNELFEGDVEAYAATLQRLLGAPSWAEASKIIAEDVFRKHQVNIYSDPAVLFTDAAELRYRR